MRSLLTGIFVLIPLLASGAELYWYVAAGMLRPAQDIVARYNSMQDEVKVVLISGGSGQLISKIRASGKADLYLPASHKFFEQISRLGLVHKSRPLLLMWPVFGVSSTNSTRKITDLNSLAHAGTTLALGNPETMALGELYTRIEENMPAELGAALRRNTLIESINIQQTVSYLHQGVVDAGLLFDSVAEAHGLAYVEIPPEWNTPAQATMVELSTSTNLPATARFADFVFLQADIFASYGFELIP